MLNIPPQLVAACEGSHARRAWLEQLPRVINELQTRWSLILGGPFDGSEVTCSWVAPAARRDGSRVVLKIGMPHMEAEHELEGLRFWDGDPTVRLLDADAGLNAMLLERCEPGTPLRELPGPEQDVVIAGLFRRLWRKQARPHPFRALSVMLDSWTAETRRDAGKWAPYDALVNEGLHLFRELSRSSSDDVVLATDVHAGNVLRASREPWLVIDPKPFIGDRAYDATQHLLNCKDRILAAPGPTIRRFADLLDVDHERVRLWLHARAAAEPRDTWDDDAFAVARAVA